MIAPTTEHTAPTKPILNSEVAIITQSLAHLNTSIHPSSPQYETSALADDILDTSAVDAPEPISPLTESESDSDIDIPSIDPFSDEHCAPGTPEPSILPVTGIATAHQYNSATHPDYFPATPSATVDHSNSPPADEYVYEFGNDLDDPIQAQDLPIIHRCPHPWKYTPTAKSDPTIPTLAFYPSPDQDPTATWVPIQDSSFGNNLTLANHYALNFVHPPMALSCDLGMGVTVADILYWTVSVVDEDWDAGFEWNSKNGHWAAVIGNIKEQTQRGLFSQLRCWKRSRKHDEDDYEEEVEEEQEDVLIPLEVIHSETTEDIEELAKETHFLPSTPNCDSLGDVRDRFYIDEDDDDLPDATW